MESVLYDLAVLAGLAAIVSYFAAKYGVECRCQDCKRRAREASAILGDTTMLDREKP